MRKLFATAASIALAVGISLPASAAIITRTFNFTATDFESIPADGPDAPFASVSGSFTVTADPDLNYPSETAGLTIHTLSIPAPGPHAFRHFSNTRSLLVGGTVNLVNGVSSGTPDFVVIINDAFDALPTYNRMFYAAADRPSHNYRSTTGTLSIGAVPEPASWAMMIAGFGLVGAGLRRRNTTIGFSFG